MKTYEYVTFFCGAAYLYCHVPDLDDDDNDFIIMTTLTGAFQSAKPCSKV